MLQGGRDETVIMCNGRTKSFVEVVSRSKNYILTDSREDNYHRTVYKQQTIYFLYALLLQTHIHSVTLQRWNTKSFDLQGVH